MDIIFAFTREINVAAAPIAVAEEILAKSNIGYPASEHWIHVLVYNWFKMKIDVKTSPFFSGTINIMGIALAFSAVVVIFFHFLIGLALLMSSVLIFTTHYRLMIDLDQRIYLDYVWIMGIKHGKTASFEKIDYLFIKRSRTVQNMSARVYTTSIQKDVYDAYLRFSETKKIHLVTRESKRLLMKQVKSLAAQQGVEVIDYTNGEGTTL